MLTKISSHITSPKSDFKLKNEMIKVDPFSEFFKKVNLYVLKYPDSQSKNRKIDYIPQLSPVEPPTKSSVLDQGFR